MRIAILGGGITGLTAGYKLAKKGHGVTIFEKEKVLGGLASSFTQDHWEWPLERAYHHLFANDYDIQELAKEIGFDKVFFAHPETASLFGQSSNFRIYPFDTPIDFLRLPLLSPAQKIRAGTILAALKLSPFLSLYETQTAEKFLKKTMGNGTWEILWQELFRKKFGKYAGNILASFIWARLKKRSKKLGYIEGGFQLFIDFLEMKNRERGVVIKKDVEVSEIKRQARQVDGHAGQFGRQGREFLINGGRFDTVVSTLPTPVLCKVAAGLLPQGYVKQLSGLKYLRAVNLIIETKERLLDKTYWLNIVTDRLPFVVLIQQTNFVDKKHYGGNNILYVGNYVERDDPLLKMEKKKLFNFFLPHLKKVNPNLQLTTYNLYLFKAPFAQPIFDREFIKNKPDFITPVRNFYIANLDMTYPYDRGTNYAVKLGREVASLIID